MREGDRPQRPSEGILLDIGEGVGALVIYTKPAFGGREIEVSRTDGDGRRIHTEVLERLLNGQSVFAAVFAALPQGTYRIWREGHDPADEVSIHSGEVAERDWR
jgi:hypothetical protein